jgi:hypothetical protein
MTFKSAVSSPNMQNASQANLRSLYARKTAIEDLIRSLEQYSRVQPEAATRKQQGAGRN